MSHAGIIGLNNIKRNDYVNVVIQALARVGDLRNFFLKPQNYAGNKDQLGMLQPWTRVYVHFSG